MKKAKQWGKPEVGVLTFTKQSRHAGSSRTRDPRYYLGPTPAPPAMDVPSREGRYYLGPTPAPPSMDVLSSEARCYLGPSPAPPTKDVIW